MSKKTLRLIIGAVMLVVIIAGVLVCGFLSRDENGAWFKNNNLSTWHWADPKEEKPVGTNHGISLLMTAIPVEDYEVYGISEHATSAKTVRAEFEPSNTTDKRVTWSIAWNNPQSNFAKNKTVTDYVNIIPAENNQPYCSIEYLNNFGEYITLRCVSNANEELYATTTIHCIGKIIDAWDCTISSVTGEIYNSADGEKDFAYDGHIGTDFTTLPDDAGLIPIVDYSIRLQSGLVEYLRENYNATIFADDEYVITGTTARQLTGLDLQPTNKTTVDTKFWQCLVSYCVSVADDWCFGFISFGTMQYYDGSSVVYVFDFPSDPQGCCLELDAEFIEQYTVNAEGLEISGNVNFI